MRRRLPCRTIRYPGAHYRGWYGHRSHHRTLYRGMVHWVHSPLCSCRVSIGTHVRHLTPWVPPLGRHPHSCHPRCPHHRHRPPRRCAHPPRRRADRSATPSSTRVRDRDEGRQVPLGGCQRHVDALEGCQTTFLMLIRVGKCTQILGLAIRAEIALVGESRKNNFSA